MNSQKVVLITGSSSGFGRVIAETLARKGYRVFASMRDSNTKNAARREQLLQLASSEKLALSVVDLDVTDERSVERAVAEVIADAGRIDVLINNAGYALWGLTEAFTLEQAQRIFDTNFFGVVRMNRCVLPHLRRQRSGLIIHVSSGAGRAVLPGMGLYTATKFALEALAESYRYELSQQGVDSISLEPGPFATEIFGKTEPGADVARSAEYGETAKVPQSVFSAIVSSAVPVQEVADLVAKLIETPAGHRPMRTLIGPIVGALQPINDTAGQIQREILTSMGMGNLLTVTSAKSEAA